MAEALRTYWDDDAATYDRLLEHDPRTSAQRAAWTGIVLRLLPPPPARVLDVGAGTGFPAILLARLGYEVTAVDISPRMLDRLQVKAAAERLNIWILEGAAESPPPGPFDAVVERLLLWTLPDPKEALVRWREVAPQGRLVSFGGIWGGADPVEALRGRVRNRLRRLRGEPPEHHARYPDLFTRIAKENRSEPAYVIETIQAAGWRSARLERLRDAEWAETLALPLPLRLLGVRPQYAVVADA